MTNAPLEASFRGQSSIECERRNWSVDLQGGDLRHPIAQAVDDAAGRLVERFVTRRSKLLDLLDAHRSANQPT